MVRTPEKTRRARVQLWLGATTRRIELVVDKQRRWWRDGVEVPAVNEVEGPLVSEEEEPADGRRQSGYPDAIAGQTKDCGHNGPMLVDSDETGFENAAY